MSEYCVSLELAKELFELGIIKDSEYWWVLYPAPIAEELLELMPDTIKYIGLSTSDDEDLSLDIAKRDGVYSILYSCFDIDNSLSKAYPLSERFHELKLSDALAKMLIWLHKNGYLK